ncbi:MAG TPA: PAS domain S-box protein, partial [Caldimonas sp.]
MVRRVGPAVLAAVAIGVALLVGNLALSVYHTKQLRDESAAVQRSTELLLALDNVLSLAVDAETGQRGYVITGKKEYLAPYRAAVGSIHAQMDALERLVGDDPVQQRLMADVRRRVGAKLGELEVTIALRDRSGFDLARDAIVLGAGHVEMEALRATAAQMAAHETTRLLAREQAAKRTYWAALLGEGVAAAAAVAVLIGLSLLLARHLRARDRTEQLLAAQGELLRTTLASIGDAVITTDTEGRIDQLNAVAEAVTGWSSAEARGQPLDAVFAIVNEATRAPAENPASRALRDGVVVGLANHTRLIRRDGSELPIDDSAAPIRDAAGTVHGCVLVFRDISERRAADRALAEAQARLSRIVTDMAIPTMVYAEDGEVILINQAWTEISGYTAEELKTIPAWTKKAYGERAETMNAVIASLFDLEASIDNGEREITTASGGTRIWHFVTAPIGRDPTGRRMLVTNAIDVTEGRRLDQALADKEARMRLAMDAANYGDWELDRASAKMVWSAQTRKLLGVGADEPISHGLFQARVHPDDRARRQDCVADAWVTGVLSNEYRIVRPDGQVRWMSSRGRVIRGPDGHERMLGVIGDITEQKKAEHALKDADRRKDEFLATLSHELRNPLAPLRNSLAVLQRSAGDPELFEKVGGVMERQLGHLVRLIDDLLDVSRFSLDKLTLRLEPTDLAAVIEHAVEGCRPAAERSGHVVELRLPEFAVKLQADRARLSQVFSNLIGNACKFTPDGGHVRVAARIDGDRAVVSVRDDGIGIAVGDLGRVFDMFAQVDESFERTNGGLGIGLTLVRRLVEMHGGTVVAKSAGLGQGSEFVVTLPLAPARAVAPPVGAGNGAAASAQRMRMLVVDDNGDSAESLALLLSLAGHETHIARDGPEALTRADALRPDAVLLDLGLPGLSGYEVCKRLRVEPWARAIPIIAITGWGQADDRRRSKEAGFDAHLVKPVVLDELTALLE